MESKPAGGGDDEDGWRPPLLNRAIVSKPLSLPSATSLIEGVEQQQNARESAEVEKAGHASSLLVDHRRIWESGGVGTGSLAVGAGVGASGFGVAEAGEKRWDDVPDLPSGDLTKFDGKSVAKQAWLGRLPDESVKTARGEGARFAAGAAPSELSRRPSEEETKWSGFEKGEGTNNRGGRDNEGGDSFGWGPEAEARARDDLVARPSRAGRERERERDRAADKSRGVVLSVQRPVTVGAPKGMEAAADGESVQARQRDESASGDRSVFPLHPVLPAIDTGEGEFSVQVPRQLGAAPRVVLHPTLSVPLLPAPSRSASQSLPSIAPRPVQPQPQHQMFLAFPDGLGGKRRPSVVPVSTLPGPSSVVSGSSVTSQYPLMSHPGQGGPPVHVQQTAMQPGRPALPGPPGGYSALPMIVPSTAGVPGSGPLVSGPMAAGVSGPRSGLLSQYAVGASPRGVPVSGGKFYATLPSSITGGGPQRTFSPSPAPYQAGRQLGALQPIAPKRSPEQFRPGAPYAIRAGGTTARPAGPQVGQMGQGTESLGLIPYSTASVDGSAPSRGLRLATLSAPGGVGLQAAGLSAPPPLPRGLVGGDATLLGAAVDVEMASGHPRDSPATRKPLGGGLSVSLDGGMEPRQRAVDDASHQWRAFGIGRPASPGSTSATYSEYSQRHGAASPRQVEILAPISSSAVSMASMSVPAVVPRRKKFGKQFQNPTLAFPVAGSSFGNAPEMDTVVSEAHTAAPLKRKRSSMRGGGARMGFSGARKSSYGGRVLEEEVEEEEEEEQGEEEGAEKRFDRKTDLPPIGVEDLVPQRDASEIVDYVPKRVFLRSVSIRPRYTRRVRINRKYLRISHPAIAHRWLWGDKVYFVDSDLVAAVVHSGKIKVTAERPPKDLVVEFSADRRKLYPAAMRNGVRSRELRDETLEHYGFQIRGIEWASVVKDLSGSESNAGSDSDGGASSEDEPPWGDYPLDNGNFVPEFSLCFGLCNQPCYVYSLATVADRGIEAKSRVSARLRKDVLYLETELQRFELQMLEDGRLQFAAVKDPFMPDAWSSGCPLERKLVNIIARPAKWDDIEWAERTIVVAGVQFWILRIFWHKRDTALQEIEDEPVPLLAALRERTRNRAGGKGTDGEGVGEEEAEHEAGATTEAESATGAEGPGVGSPADELLDSATPEPQRSGVEEEREEGNVMAEEDQDADEERDGESRPVSPADGDGTALPLGDEAAVAILSPMLSPKLTAAAAELERLSPKLSAKLAEVAELERKLSPKLSPRLASEAAEVERHVPPRLSPKLAEAGEMERRRRERRAKPARRPR